MKKITTFILLATLMVTANELMAQNLIPDWDANGATGAGTEANKWGFAASTGGTDWGTANGGGVRYRDLTGIAKEGGGTFTGREFLYRWEGSYVGSTMSLGLPTEPGTGTGHTGITLEAGKAYTFTGLFEWINNANAPTYEFGVSDAPDGGNIVVTKEYSSTTRELFIPFEVYFVAPSNGEYYIQLKQTGGLSGSAGGLIGLADLSLEETAVLSIDDISSAVSSNIKAIGSRIYVFNVKSLTEINIYSLTGALVKSFHTNSDIDFDFKSGFWIASIKTINGEKSVKLLTR